MCDWERDYSTKLRGPRGVEVDGRGNIMVAHANNNLVVVFNPKPRPKPNPRSADVVERGIASIGVRSSGNL